MQGEVLNAYMKIISRGYTTEQLNLEPHEEIKKMDLASGLVITYYEMFPLDNNKYKELNKKLAVGLQKKIKKECPEHLI